MDERIRCLSDLAERQLGMFTREQAYASGLTPAALRNGIDRGRWVPVTTRVLRMAGVSGGPFGRLWAAVLDADAAVSHASAAWLWRIPGFDPVPIQVSRPMAVTHRPSRVAVVHFTRHLSKAHLGVVQRLPVTLPARTLCDLAAVVHPRRLERAIDTALSRGLTSHTELVQVAGELGGRGRTGARALRTVLAVRDPDNGPVDSELEARFRALLRRYGLPQPERQVVLGNESQAAGRVDCFFRQARLVVELDGRAYHSSVLDRAEDTRRDLVLLRGGLRVLRLTWHDVVDRGKEVADALRDLLRIAA